MKEVITIGLDLAKHVFRSTALMDWVRWQSGDNSDAVM